MLSCKPCCAGVMESRGKNEVSGGKFTSSHLITESTTKLTDLYSEAAGGRVRDGDLTSVKQIRESVTLTAAIGNIINEKPPNFTSSNNVTHSWEAKGNTTTDNWNISGNVTRKDGRLWETSTKSTDHILYNSTLHDDRMNYSTPEKLLDTFKPLSATATTDRNSYGDDYDYLSGSNRNNDDHNSSLLLTNYSPETSIPFLLHIYGFATLYIWLDLFITFMTITSKKRVVKRHDTLAVIVFSAIFSTNFAVMLIGDPYGVRHLLPNIIITLVLYFKYVSFIIVFWLIQRVLKSMSCMKQLQNNTKNNNNNNTSEVCNNNSSQGVLKRKMSVFMPLCLFYSCVLLTLGITTAVKPELHVLHLIPQAIYITSMIVLCFTFLYSALNISQYTEQTSRVLDETIIYSKMQSKLKENGRCTDISLDLYRVERDKLDFQGDASPYDDLDNVTGTGNNYHNAATESSSNESLTFFNHIALTDPRKLEQFFCNRQNNNKEFVTKDGEKWRENHVANKITSSHAICKKKSHSATKSSKMFCMKKHYAVLESTTGCDYSSDCDNGNVPTRVSPSTPNAHNGIIDQKNTFPVRLQMQKMTSMLQRTKSKKSGQKGGKHIDRKSPPIPNQTTVFSNEAFSFDNHFDEVCTSFCENANKNKSLNRDKQKPTAQTKGKPVQQVTFSKQQVIADENEEDDNNYTEQTSFIKSTSCNDDMQLKCHGDDSISVAVNDNSQCSTLIKETNHSLNYTPETVTQCKTARKHSTGGKFKATPLNTTDPNTISIASSRSTLHCRKAQNGSKILGTPIAEKRTNSPVTLISQTREIFLNDRFEDNGYLADTENALMEDCGAGDDAGDNEEQGSDGGEQPGQDIGDKTSCRASNKCLVLPKRSCNYVGLQRVRQSRCVKRIMHSTYCTTVFAFLLSVLELYEMFSMKGVLTGVNGRAENTWLLFQSFLR